MIKLSPSQQAVVDAFPAFLMDDTTEMAISGFAGYGKSYLVRYLADIGEKQQKLVKLIDPKVPYKNLFFTATTNKAAKVLNSILHRQAQTIHSLLGLRVQVDFKTGKEKLVPKGNRRNLTNSIVFIDEASMINMQLLEVIRDVAHTHRNCKLVFIGDKYQLPPVKENVCPVFDQVKNLYELKEVQRQVADSPIIQLSAKYRDILDDPNLDWPIIPHDGKHIVKYDNKEDYLRTVRSYYQNLADPEEIRILAWSNKRVTQYNDWIRKLQGKTHAFEIGEKVISNKPIIENGTITLITDGVYTIEDIYSNNEQSVEGWDIKLEEKSKPIFHPKNQAKAREYLNSLAKEAKKNRNWKEYYEVKDSWGDFRPPYASTVHKSQGSTYREVFIDLDNIGKNTKWYEVARLAYVGITRASETVHVYGTLENKYDKTNAVNSKVMADNLKELFKDVDCK